MPVDRYHSASTSAASAMSSGYFCLAFWPPPSQLPTGGPARPIPAGPVKPACSSPFAIIVAIDLPSGVCTTLGGTSSVVTCSSSSTTQVTLDESRPYSLLKIPLVHTPVVTE